MTADGDLRRSLRRVEELLHALEACADAAAVLRWAAHDDLVEAAQIGADIAFCLVGGRARVRGIGEIVEPLPFVALDITLVVPPLAVSTPAAPVAASRVRRVSRGSVVIGRPSSKVVDVRRRRRTVRQWPDGQSAGSMRATPIASSAMP